MSDPSSVRTTQPASVPLDRLIPLMRAKGATLPPAEFHSHVNLVFHAFEARQYDRIHRNMWESLPQQFELLVDDYLRRHRPKPRLSVLDVGCGTGLSSELLVRTRLRQYIGSVDLLDPSSEMLEICGRRRSIWHFRRHIIRGAIENVPVRPAYDVIMACSVLHHIPDLEEFTRAVAMRQAPGGIFLHVQDPNADHEADPEFRSRSKEWSESPAARMRPFLKKLHPLRAGRAAARLLLGVRHRSYVDQVNEELLQLGVIRRPMTPEELWSVTDLHEYHANGISISTIGQLLPEYELVSRRSYSFCGELPSDLPRRFRKLERDLIARKAQNGSRAGAVWIRRGASPVS